MKRKDSCQDTFHLSLSVRDYHIKTLKLRGIYCSYCLNFFFNTNQLSCTGFKETFWLFSGLVTYGNVWKLGGQKPEALELVH